MYKIKQIPEDFMVWELPTYDIASEGDYAYFWLRKKNYNTLDAIKQIAVNLKIPLKNVGFAGNKDRAAITEQVVSIRAIKEERVTKLKLKDIELSFIGNGEKPISLGDLEGNRFRITVRDINKKFLSKNTSKIPNFFGEQRFSKSNADIGKALVLKNFKKAVDLIDQTYVKEYIEENTGDFAGALRQMPLKLRRMFVHSYQSLLWNKVVEEYLKTKPFRNEKISLVGFGTTLNNDKISGLIRTVMNKECITSRDFVISQIPEISSEGGERDLFVSPENFKIDFEKDELNKYKEKAIVSFTLPKGCYATVVIDYLFGPQ